MQSTRDGFQGQVALPQSSKNRVLVIKKFQKGIDIIYFFNSFG